MLLDRDTWFIKERVALVKLTDTYDIIDPNDGQVLAIAREEPKPWAKYLRLLLNKALMPTTVNIYPGEGMPAELRIERGNQVFRRVVTVWRGDRKVGYFKSKVFAIGGGFYVFDATDRQIADIKGNIIGWNFKFLAPDGSEIGTVTKKWAGFGKELLTSADNYVIALNPTAPKTEDSRALLLAAGLAIDMLYFEAQ